MGFSEEFKNPPAENRPKPFWFWNGDMEDQEVDRQLEEMAEKGLGGAFICARQGMTIPYLSSEWFQKIERACKKANELGLENWLYDEYPYPSGVSGGEVLLEHPEAKQKILKVFRRDIQDGDRQTMDLGWGRILYAKAIPTDGQGILNWEQAVDIKDEIGNLQTEEIYQESGLTAYSRKRFFSYGPRHIYIPSFEQGKYRILIFSSEELKDFKYYGSYVDACNKEAVKSFLDTTHEKYKACLGGQFGKTIHGMFSDETGIIGRLPWSEEMEREFERKNGYGLEECLPALAETGYPDAYRRRYDYFNTIHELFVESYHEQNSRWCRENNLQYATEVPLMRLSTEKYSHIIGGDTAHEKLGRPLEWIFDKYLHHYRSNARALASLARQLDRKYCMIESFHSVGWSMTIQDAKWMIDYLGTQGINFFNFHAFYYTIDAMVKHDAPPSQFFQNPYWKHYRKLADYVGRVSVLNTWSESVNNVAVLDPVASLWCLMGNGFQRFRYAGFNKQEEEQCRQMIESWLEVCKEIVFHQINYDHLDGDLLADAAVKEGKIFLGRAAYDTLVLTPSICIERKSADKLAQFLDQGGKVIAVGQLPAIAVGGDPDLDGLTAAMEQSAGYTHVESASEMAALLKEALGAEFEIRLPREAAKEFLYSRRKDDRGREFFFLANHGGEEVDLEISLKEKDGYHVENWNLETGEVTLLKDLPERIRLHLSAYESACVCAAPGKPEELPVIQQRPQEAVDLTGELDVTAEGDNVYRLESWEISLDGENWKPVKPKTLIEQLEETELITGKCLRKTGEFGTPGEFGVRYPLTVAYRADFKAETVPEVMKLLFECHGVRGKWKLCINGMEFLPDQAEKTAVNDNSDRVLDISKAVRKGDNRILVSVEATDDFSGIRDPFYLLGDFGVVKRDGAMVITDVVKRAELSGSYIEGYPYYSGSFLFQREVTLDAETLPEEFSLKLLTKDELHDCAEVIWNGKSLGTRAFSPYLWNLKKEDVLEKNEVSIRYTNTLANMLDGTYFDYEKHQIVTI